MNNIKAEDRDFLDFITGRNSFIIPVYQRNYAWNQKDCERLFDDIANIHYNQLDTYFMGATVVVSEGRNKLLLIDGQQRITSISLLLLAIRNILIESPELSTDPENNDLADDIWTDYLVNPKKSNNGVPLLRLKQVNKDDTAYEHLILNKDSNDHMPHLKKQIFTKTINFFKEKLVIFVKMEKIALMIYGNVLKK